ncbi:MAG: glutamate racemase [Acidobacteriota bacterium]|nr:glutamate racemase [Acidobacteriota bacterium]
MSWGVFDSGVGGLTVVRALEAAVGSLRLVYLGDTARVPYGTRSPATVRRYAAQAAAFLRDAGVGGIIVACNTASAVALDVVGRVFDGPVLGVVEPGVEAALETTRNGRIGVIGTQATVGSDAYGRALRARRRDVQVFSRACPLFVPLAEEGWTRGEVPRLVAERYLGELREEKIDTLVLGCTHYPLLREVIGEVMGPGVRLVDSAEAAADRARGVRPPGAEQARSGERFCVTDGGGRFAEVAARFLGRPLGALETVRLEGD